MAFTPFNFAGLPLVRSVNPGLENMFSGTVGAYQGAKGEELKRQEQAFKNALMQQYGQREKEADIGLKEAHADFYRNPLQFATPFQKEAIGAYSENPEMLQQIMEQRARGLASGQQKLPSQIVAKTINSAVANQMRNRLLEEIKPPYIGEGSNKALYNDVKRYKSTMDEQEKMALGYKLATQIVAEKMVPELSFLTLTANRVNPTVSALKHQSEVTRYGWPEAMGWFKKNLPKEIQELADEIHAQRVQELTKMGMDSYQGLTSGMGNALFDGYGDEMIPQGGE